MECPRARPTHASGRKDVCAALAVATDFAGGSRGNTGVHLRAGDLVVLTGGEKVMRLRARKGLVLHEAITGKEKVLRFPAAQMDGWQERIEKFQRVRELEDVCGGDDRESYYRISGVERTWNWDVQRRTVSCLAVSLPWASRFSTHTIRCGTPPRRRWRPSTCTRRACCGCKDGRRRALPCRRTLTRTAQQRLADCYWAFVWLLPPPVAPSAAQMAVLASAIGIAPDEALASRWASVASAWSVAGGASA